MSVWMQIAAYCLRRSVELVIGFMLLVLVPILIINAIIEAVG